MQRSPFMESDDYFDQIVDSTEKCRRKPFTFFNDDDPIFGSLPNRSSLFEDKVHGDGLLGPAPPNVASLEDDPFFGNQLQIRHDMIHGKIV